VRNYEEVKNRLDSLVVDLQWEVKKTMHEEKACLVSETTGRVLATIHRDSDGQWLSVGNKIIGYKESFVSFERAAEYIKFNCIMYTLKNEIHNNTWGGFQ
jgi:hypothetical protein